MKGWWWWRGGRGSYSEDQLSKMLAGIPLA